MGHVSVGHRWDRVTMDILDMSVSTERGNRYVIFDCFSRRTEACPLPNKMAIPADYIPLRYAGGNPFGSGPRI